MTADVGRRLVEAISAQDEAAIAACFTPEMELLALIPRGLRERTGAREAAAMVASWFADSTELELVESRMDEVGDRLRISYRFEGVEEGEPYVVEQHLVCALADGKIERTHLLCSGFRPRIAALH